MEKPGAADVLAGDIAKAIERYRKRHTDVTVRTILAALRRVMTGVTRSALRARNIPAVSE
jgi:hypothetical protein